MTISILPLVISLKDLLSLAAGKSHPKLSWLWLLSGHNLRLIVSAVGVFVISSSEDEESTLRAFLTTVQGNFNRRNKSL